MQIWIPGAAAVVFAVAGAGSARAECGMMVRPLPIPAPVAQPQSQTVASAPIVNTTTKVAVVRDGDLTIMTMANDFAGAPADFGIVVPVPSPIEKGDVAVVDGAVFDELERATAPRAVETEDVDPCPPETVRAGQLRVASADAAPPSAPAAPRERASDYGVKVENHFFAGEYDIAVLSGKDSTGLVTWLRKFHHDVPDGAAPILESYIKQSMRFFVARVHVAETGNGPRFLRPLRVRYRTPKFMLPIRLGTVNANGPQEMLVYAFSRAGRVEPTNYRATALPGLDVELPEAIKGDLAAVYAAHFDAATRALDGRVVFIETVMPTDPDVISDDTLRTTPAIRALGLPHDGDGGVVTRLHFRHDKTRFPEDLVLQETRDTKEARVVYRSRKLWSGAARCDAARAYLDAAPRVRDTLAQNLAKLTGWSVDEARRRSALP